MRYHLAKISKIENSTFIVPSKLLFKNNICIEYISVWILKKFKRTWWWHQDNGLYNLHRKSILLDEEYKIIDLGKTKDDIKCDTDIKTYSKEKYYNRL
jgi:hypothetical protein